MLVLAEFTKQRKEHVQTLYQRFIIRQFVHWDIKHWKDNPCIAVGVHIYVRSWELHFLKSLLHLRVHLRHELVEVRHLLGIVDRWRWPGLVQVLHTIDPPGYVLWSLVSILYWLYTHGCSPHNVFTLDVFEFQNCFVFTIQRWLVQLSYTEVLLLTVRLRHLKACVHFSNCWNVVWDEWLQLGFEINLLWFVSLDVLEEFLDFWSNLQIGVFDGVVGTRNILIIVTIVLLILLPTHASTRIVLLLLLLLSCCCGLSRILLCTTNIIHIYFIIFFLTFDLLAIIDIYS